MQKAFVAAEDKRFYQHKGIDERGLIRAFIGNLAEPGRPQGGSTITQQVAKNLLVGDDVTYERKMREMIVAARLEQTLIEGRDPRDLSQLDLSRPRLLGHRDGGAELFREAGAALDAAGRRAAGRPDQGPELLQPRPASRARPRALRLRAQAHAGGRASITEQSVKQGLAALPRIVAFERPRRDSGFHFVDHLGRDARALAGIDGLTAVILHGALDASIPTCSGRPRRRCRRGSPRYELNTGRQQFSRRRGQPRRSGPSARRTAPEPPSPAWQRALEAARLPLYDVHWPAAVVVEQSRDRKTAPRRSASAWRTAAIAAARRRGRRGPAAGSS